MPVRTGISNDGQVELVEGNLKENDEVIVEQISSQKKSGGTAAHRWGRGSDGRGRSSTMSPRSTPWATSVSKR